MSSDTVPAAVPAPTTPAPAAPAAAPVASPQPGLFASLVAPVEPARPAFSLTPTAPGQHAPQDDPADDTTVPPGGASSANYHTDETPSSGTNNGSTETGETGGAGKFKQGMLRALVLAAAARWAKGGGTANKRLDMQKAKAQAWQIKEARQVNVNRSPGVSGQSGGKSLDRKSGNGGPRGSGRGAQKNGSGTGPGKAGNGQGSAGQGSSGRSGNTGDTGSTGNARNDGSAGRGNGAARGSAGGASQPGTTKGPAPKPPKPTTDPKAGTAGASGSGTAGAKGSAGAPGKAAPMAKNNKNGPSDKIPQQTTAAKDATPASGNAGNDPGRRKTDLKKTPKPNSAPDNSKGQPNSTKTPKPDVDLAQGKPFSTQGSRETGYRDGTRAAEAAAHVKAYRDGLKDGWADTTEAAEREKARLDQTHQDRKQAREETPVTTDTSTDHHTDTSTDGPQPIKVDGIDATHLYLGDAAARPVISRGEVRTLKQYERRLADRLGGLQKTTEITKRLEAHAISQAQKALDLLEKARGVKGGDTFLGKLTRLHEDAQRQAAEAAEIHKRAVRAADACGALLANVATRYGDMYQAVVDSPETAPAELAYYQGA